MSLPNTCSQCQTSLFFYSDETLCYECLKFQGTEAPQNTEKYSKSVPVTPIKSQPRLNLGTPRIGSPKILFPELRLVRNYSQGGRAMVRGVCDQCRKFSDLEYLESPCAEHHFKSLEKLVEKRWIKMVVVLSEYHKNLTLADIHIDPFKDFLNHQRVPYTVIEATDEAQTPRETDTTQACLDIISRLASVRPENCDCADHDICTCPKKTPEEATEQAVSQLEAACSVTMTTQDQLWWGRIERNLDAYLEKLPPKEKRAVEDFVEILKKDGYCPDSPMILGKNDNQVVLCWADIEYGRGSIYVSHFNSGQEIYEEFRRLGLLQKIGPSGCGPSGCGPSDSPGEKFSRPCKNPMDQRKTPKLTPARTCPRLVYKGQTRQRKCGKGLYKLGLCYRHYHNKYYWLM